VTGGFWSLIAVVQTAGLPNLSIAQSGNSVIVSWPNAGSYTLQQNNNLAAPVLDNERLFHHDQQRHEQHHHHIADRKPVLPVETVNGLSQFRRITDPDRICIGRRNTDRVASIGAISGIVRPSKSNQAFILRRNSAGRRV